MFPARTCLAALGSFRQTRLTYAAGKHRQPAGEDFDASIGDDPLAISSSLLLVGVDRQYGVVYGMVNTIYVLGITTIHNNVFDPVLVSACRGVDVTPEKLHQKYVEV